MSVGATSKYGWSVYSQETKVPSPQPVALQEGNAVKYTRDGGESRDDFCKYPFAISADVRFLRGMKINTVQAGDSESENELEEAEDRAANCADSSA